MTRKRAVIAALAVMLAGAGVIVTGGHSSSTTVQAKDAAAVSGFPTHMIGWQHGTTTTTTSPPPPPTTAAPAPQPAPVRHVASQPRPQATGGGGGGDFAACVRQHESGGNYSINTGNGYHGAYQMTNSHWSGYGGYSSADQAPPSVQDAKFRDDVSHGSAYMHQQYPQTSRMCGG